MIEQMIAALEGATQEQRDRFNAAAKKQPKPVEEPAPVAPPAPAPVPEPQPAPEPQPQPDRLIPVSNTQWLENRCYATASVFLMRSVVEGWERIARRIGQMHPGNPKLSIVRACPAYGIDGAHVTPPGRAADIEYLVIGGGPNHTQFGPDRTEIWTADGDLGPLFDAARMRDLVLLAIEEFSWICRSTIAIPTPRQKISAAVQEDDTPDWHHDAHFHVPGDDMDNNGRILMHSQIKAAILAVTGEAKA